MKNTKYNKEIKPGITVDVYDVLVAWEVTNPALQHMIKKALQCGHRGHKTIEEDMDDILACAIRAKEIEIDNKHEQSPKLSQIRTEFTPKSSMCWEDGTGKDGFWNGGLWQGGTWEGGRWINGTWKDGIWKNGLWKNGIWKYGTWEKGIWDGGLWQDGIWQGGTWKGGTWKNGLWEDGLWQDGTWEGGRWINGTWEGGRIWDPSLNDYVESEISPAEYFNNK